MPKPAAKPEPPAAALPPPDGAQVSVVSIDDLACDPANLRLHDERSKSGIAASLQRFGPARSIVVDDKGVVRAGNGTVEAARRAGVKDVLVVEPKAGQLVAVRRGDWSPSEATAYSISDNRLSDLSSFDDAALVSTIQALQSEDVPLDAIGYTDAEFDELLTRLADDRGGIAEADEAAGDGDSKILPERWMVVIECTDEAQQVELLERFQGEGLSCKAIIG